MLIFALLAFTTIRTSPLTTGLESGASLSKTAPKQRYLSVKEIVWTLPVVSEPTIVRFDFEELIPAEPDSLRRAQFSGRYFSLPPPA
jgi:hypothetical protein